MPRVIGLTIAKINGIFRVHMKNVRWEVTKSVNQIPTAGGVQESVGLKLVSGACDEVIPADEKAQFDWLNLDDFALQIYDQETRKILIHESTGNNWDRLSGQSDVQAATAGRSISWKGTDVTKA